MTRSIWQLRREIRSLKSIRNGSILLLVLVLVACLSVVVYSFTSHSSSGLFLVDAHRKQLAQSLLAESAIEAVLWQMDHPDDHSHRKQVAGGITQAKDLGLPAGRIAVCQSRPNRKSIRFGLSNESAKLNLYYLGSKQITRELAVSKLLQYPGMSTQIAEGIIDTFRGPEVDGRDVDDAVGRRHAGPSQLSDLLKVAGVTKELLFGEDTNNNGLLDWHENDGRKSEPADNADGVLQGGWAAHWTLAGAETTFMPDGQPKINLNQPDLAKLYDQLIECFTSEQARFVIAWRSSPATYDEDSSSTAIAEARKLDDEMRTTTVQDRIQQQLGRGASPEFTPTTRAGIQLGGSRGIRLPSLHALADCKVQITIDGQDQVLVSPFASEGSAASDWIRAWEQKTTLSELPVDVSRIDINQASLESLMTIRGMTKPLAVAIIKTRQAIIDHPKEFETVNWLIERGLVTPSELRRISPECTTRGSLYSAVAVGELEGSRNASMIQFTVDSRLGPSRLLRRVDIGTAPSVLKP